MKNKIPVITYDRVCGYYSITKNFNLGKKAELKDRYKYHEADLIKALEANPRRSGIKNIEI